MYCVVLVLRCTCIALYLCECSPGEDGELQGHEAMEADTFVAVIMHSLTKQHGLLHGVLLYSVLTDADLQRCVVCDDSDESRTASAEERSSGRSTLTMIRRTWVPGVLISGAQQLHRQLKLFCQVGLHPDLVVY